MTHLREFLAAAQARHLPPFLSSQAEGVGANYETFLRLRKEAGASGSHVYGSDTLPGHLAALEHETMNEARVQETILSSHLLGRAPHFSDEAARHITLAKLYSIAALGPTVSRETYEAMCKAFEASDFAPRLPRRASYSCGDVIPATHWLAAFLEWTSARGGLELKTGETMALINGAFVHVGASTHLFARLEPLWKGLLVAYRASAKALGAKRSTFFIAPAAKRAWLEEACRFASHTLPAQRQGMQPQVSVRAMPQILEAIGRQIHLLASEIEHCLLKPSGNPLVSSDFRGEDAIAESGSFINPSLAIAAESLLESLLLAAWGSAQRIQHLTAPAIMDRTFGEQSESLQARLVQVPKLAMANLELMRERYPRILFASGSSTSFGEEDIWTNGVNTCIDAMKCIEDVLELTAIEHYLASLINAPETAALVEAYVGPQLIERCSGDLRMGSDKVDPELFWNLV